MRRKDKAITDKIVTEKILNSAMVCRIAFADENTPYIVPVNYAYFNNSIFFHSAPDGRKIEFLKKNNTVCFEMEEISEILPGKFPCNFSTRYRSVIGYGTVKIVSDKNEKIAGLNLLVNKYGLKGKFSYTDSSLNSVIVLRIDISELSGKQSGLWNN